MAAGASTARFPHLPALDGLRGLALVGVLLFHADGALRGGYLGVDLFFVLSGYLITALLVAEHAADGRIALGAFWARRARRLLPALFVLLPFVALYARFVASPGELRTIRGDALATLAYVANWRAIVAAKSYWDLFAAPSPLEHTWSLSIEEQFYVAWPLVAGVVLARAGRRGLFAVSAVLAVASAAAMLALFRAEAPSRVYLGTDTRAAGILVGAAFAIVVPPGTRASLRATRALDVLGCACATGLALAWTTLDGRASALYRGGFWVTELFALGLVACAVAGEGGLVARALRARPFTFVGTLSYGLYLWHWPVNVLLTSERAHLHGWVLQGARFALTFAVALASYHLVEAPVRAGRLRLPRPLVLVPSVFVASALVLVVATAARPGTAEAAQRDALRAPSLAPPTEEAVELRVLFLGDSSANALGWSLRGVSEPGVVVDLDGRDGCTMLGDTCNGSSWAEAVEERRPDATVVVLGGAFMHGLPLDGSFRKACYPGWDRRFEHKLAVRLAELSPAARAVYLATVPYPLGPWETADFRRETECINASIVRVAQAVPGLRVLDLADRLCPGGVCVREHEGHAIRPDGVHYDVEASSGLARWVLASVRPSAP